MGVELLELFWSFVKIGFSSFGGLSMVPIINGEMQAHGWMTSAEVTDIIAIAEMTPGPLGLNCATFAGMRVAGVLGAILANLGILSPTLTIGSATAIFYERFKKAKVLEWIMTGIRPGCIGLVCSVIITLGVGCYAPDWVISWPTVLIGCISIVCLFKLKLSIPATIGISAVLGVIFL